MKKETFPSARLNILALLSGLEVESVERSKPNLNVKRTTTQVFTLLVLQHICFCSVRFLVIIQ